MFSLPFALIGLMLLGVRGHMTIWSKSMYGVGPNFTYVTTPLAQPCDPLGPDWTSVDQWWFRGPTYRALPPAAGQVTELKAGASVTFEISCHVAWTSFGVATTVPGSALDACPGNSGAFHSGDPSSPTIDDSLLSGCALAIADVDDIEKVTMDNLVIFTVQKQCVKQKLTTFEIPAAMPTCKGKKCICGWFWLANNGTGNFYMTAFDCSVTNTNPSLMRSIQTPLVDPYFCGTSNNASCIAAQQTVAKRPIYAYNAGTNVPWIGNYDRAGYHEKWGWTDGAQNGIFGNKVVVAPTPTTTTTTIKVMPTTTKRHTTTTTKRHTTTTTTTTTTTKKPSTTTHKHTTTTTTSKRHQTTTTTRATHKPTTTTTRKTSHHHHPPTTTTRKHHTSTTTKHIHHTTTTSKRRRPTTTTTKKHATTTKGHFHLGTPRKMHKNRLQN